MDNIHNQKKKIGHFFLKKSSFDYYKKAKYQYNKYQNHLKKRKGVQNAIEEETTNLKHNNSTFEESNLMDNKFDDNSDDIFNNFSKNLSNICAPSTYHNKFNSSKNFSNIKIIKTNSFHNFNKYDNINSEDDLKKNLKNDEIISKDYNSFFFEETDKKNLPVFLNNINGINLTENSLNNAFYFPKYFINQDSTFYHQNQGIFNLNFFQSKFINNYPFSQNLNNNNNNNSFNIKLKQTTKTLINNNQNKETNDNINEKIKENTEILNVNIKISENENLIFKIRRYDDMFLTVKIFCEINQIDPKFIKPIILHLIKILNCIYSLYNINLTTNDINILKGIKNNL